MVVLLSHSLSQSPRLSFYLNHRINYLVLVASSSTFINSLLTIQYQAFTMSHLIHSHLNFMLYTYTYLYFNYLFQSCHFFFNCSFHSALSAMERMSSSVTTSLSSFLLIGININHVSSLSLSPCISLSSCRYTYLSLYHFLNTSYHSLPIFFYISTLTSYLSCKFCSMVNDIVNKFLTCLSHYSF